MPDGGDYDGSIATVLEQLRVTAGLEGVAVLDLSEIGTESPVAYCLGVAGVGTTEFGRSLLKATPHTPSYGMTKDKRPVLSCPWIFPPSRPGGLLMWRAPRGRAWTDADHSLAASLAMLLRVALGAGMGQVGIDRLTGLPNRRWFLDEADRYIDRLDQDGEFGTLLLVDIDDLRGLNLAVGRAQGDRVLVRMATQLRAMVRPGDLVARVGADEFAVWQNGMDHLTAAERADSLCTRQLFGEMLDGHCVTFSVGIASRAAGSTEDIRTMLRRAHMAASEVKANGGDGWRVGHIQPFPPCAR